MTCSRMRRGAMLAPQGSSRDSSCPSSNRSRTEVARPLSARGARAAPFCSCHVEHGVRHVVGEHERRIPERDVGPRLVIAPFAEQEQDRSTSSPGTLLLATKERARDERVLVPLELL